MKPLPQQVDTYLRRRAAQGPWKLAGHAGQDFAGAIVIPSLAEGVSLHRTLASLSHNPASERAHVLVVIVINQPENASGELTLTNLADLAWLAEAELKTELNLAWVDASSPDRALPQRHAGVGLARKIGLDLALSRLDWDHSPWLVCLDADTLVEANYLAAIRQHFAVCPAGAATLAFQHQDVENTRHQVAINSYELFIRSYTLGLAAAGSPYAFTAVGSAMACRANTYLRCGGMNRRKAGEDFYFLQQAVKTDAVATLARTRVHPSSRVSQRTPFGTGRSITRQLDEASPMLFYPTEAFQVLRAWLCLIKERPQAQADELIRQSAQISSPLSEFLNECQFASTWQRLQANATTPEQVLIAFHGWFDGLKTLRLIHHLCDQASPRREAEHILRNLGEWCGLDLEGSLEDQLTRIRQAQARPALFSIGNVNTLC